MDIQTLIKLCKAYSKLGWAGQEQLSDVLDDTDLSRLNGNALKMIVEFLRKAEDNEVVDAGDAADQIEEYLRFALQGDCEINVMRLGVSSKAAVDFDDLMEEARSAGMDRGDRKYLLFVDDPGFECGTARVSRDNTRGDLNQSNHAYLYAAVGRSCWVAKAAAHELIHVLGGVQDDAPHSSHGWHCTDEHDIMCYSDLPFHPVMSFPCTSPDQEHLIDCNGDDYFNVNPPIGSYLADHWNVADSMFLIKVEPMLWLAGIVK